MIVPVHCSACDTTVNAERKSSSNVVTCPNCGSEASAPLGLIPGTILGNGYRIDSLKAETRQGDTFLGFQTTMEREVLIKTLAPHLTNDHEAMGCFLREAKLTGGLQHPNILRAIDAGEDCGIYFLVSDYRPGATLKDHIEASGVLKEQEALEWLVPIMHALKHAWNEKKVLHRNVKPEHILLPESGPPLLTDLGIAKSLENDSMDLTGTDFTVGTPEYMSPEQIEGENMDTRADMYSLGIVLFECVTGRRPFQSVSAVELLTMHLEKPPPRADDVDGVSRRCADLIDRMLAKNPAERFATWDAAIAAAESVISGDNAIVSAPEPLPKPAAAPRKRKPQAKPRAEGVSRRDVERIAEQMNAKSAARTRTILFILSALVPIAIFAFVMHKKNSPAQPPSPPPPAVQPLAEEPPASKPARRRRLHPSLQRLAILATNSPTCLPMLKAFFATTPVILTVPLPNLSASDKTPRAANSRSWPKRLSARSGSPVSPTSTPSSATCARAPSSGPTQVRSLTPSTASRTLTAPLLRKPEMPATNCSRSCANARRPGPPSPANGKPSCSALRLVSR